MLRSRMTMNCAAQQTARIQLSRDRGRGAALGSLAVTVTKATGKQDRLCSLRVDETTALRICRPPAARERLRRWRRLLVRVQVQRHQELDQFELDQQLPVGGCGHLRQG